MDAAYSICVEPCSVGSCPSGFGCLLIGGGSGACWPNYDEADGCSTSGAAPLGLGATLGALLLSRRRRR